MHFWLWIFVFFGALILELVTSTMLISVWFCVGAAVALLASMLHLAFIWQVVLFFIASLLCLAAIRPAASRYLRGNTIATNADRYVGLRTKLLKTLTRENWGEVKIHGVIWNVAGVDDSMIPEGSNVEVIAIEGSKLIVKKVEG